MPGSWSTPVLSDAQLHEVERTILLALHSRDVSNLRVLGIGELGLAVGWPSDKPTSVIKRQAPGPADQVEGIALQRIHAVV